jgi:hypothetical protein
VTISFFLNKRQNRLKKLIEAADRKMELLGKVYDGSEHDVGDGYHL